ncbi:MAG: pyridoxamine 5'-phosphate oxidase [Cyclobacteriaceae bacterium]|nr:pyridoxamine 5'-phosphate oxidase [Cyclobacteriaceae bacterium]UYN85150.1 MAG: pyridoxamine 5'-phosphate oxidase [Cyclobacteriaceae bacterium]
MSSISNIRTEYTKATLDVDSVHPHPIEQFSIWFNEALAAKLPEPTAMHLATVNEHGNPSSRIVLLKGVEDSKFVFYTNYQSHKGKHLDNHPACALTFFWPELERQVRIEGTVSRIEAERSDEYFKSRPRASQIGAWSSPQSHVIANRAILEERVKQMEKRFEHQDPLPRPRQWGGYAVDPLMIEFWQGRPSRLHDRILYAKANNTWSISRLAP